MGKSELVKLTEILPTNIPTKAVSLVVQLVSTVKDTFILSPALNKPYKVVSFVFNPLVYKAKLSTLNTKLSLLVGGGFVPMLVISSLPQAIINEAINIIFKVTTTFLTVFNVCLSLAVTNLTFFFTVLTEVNLSKLLKYHFKIWFLSFRSWSSNFFTYKDNHFQGIFQYTNLGIQQINVSYI